MTDHPDSIQPPQLDSASSDHGAARARGQEPLFEDRARVSDDLRAQTEAVTATVEALKRRCSDTIKLGDELASIERATRRMTHLVDELLDVSKIRRGTLVLCRDAVCVEDLIEEALVFLRAHARRERVELEHPLPESPTVLRCDEDRVLRLLTNLIAVAINGTARDGSVGIRTWNAQEGVTVAISDSGPGRATTEQELAAVCERSSVGRPRPGADAGLGLHVARSIAAAHGGSIDIHVESRVPGVTISLVLPREPPDLRDGERTSAESEAR